MEGKTDWPPVRNETTLENKSCRDKKMNEKKREARGRNVDNNNKQNMKKLKQPKKIRDT